MSASGTSPEPSEPITRSKTSDSVPGAPGGDNPLELEVWSKTSQGVENSQPHIHDLIDEVESPLRSSDRI